MIFGLLLLLLMLCAPNVGPWLRLDYYGKRLFPKLLLLLLLFFLPFSFELLMELLLILFALTPLTYLNNPSRYVYASFAMFVVSYATLSFADNATHSACFAFELASVLMCIITKRFFSFNVTLWSRSLTFFFASATLV